MADNATLRELLVRSLRHESEGVVSLRLEPREGTLEHWEPGAHIDLVVADGSTRQYSLCGSPSDPDYRIAVLREPAGRGGSEHLHRTVRPGDIVQVKGPRNHFALEDAPLHVLVAGGIGITPILPMLAKLEADGAPWRLYYAGRSRTTMAFLDELAPYGDKVTLAPSDEGTRLAFASMVADAPADALWYACGPQRMLDGVSEALAAAGREDMLRTELFVAPEADVAAPAEGLTVELRSSGLTLPVPPDRSILEVVTEAGIDVMSDCEEGICGSCETKVLEGVPDHRDYVLTSQEKAQNDCMMICVSRAQCPVLVLDL
ncbi:PDR/VanB family oxidoreductase [Salinibacterium sp. SYSU T00001]|uniref:PDR/VanB family oxidoreductase n=1 Tax=Homoserinimonas sedimenticola TaxID=2986805 RepID=UPI002235F376|nr:PDR/VanB family oxidoreductase [Salinibacterium sedimenticola]MCW4385070.1 PDR/VanB family oxidoreductase [Salinibacterium sedimenticola]